MNRYDYVRGNEMDAWFVMTASPSTGRSGKQAYVRQRTLCVGHPKKYNAALAEYDR
jgi:hypothetical protein